MSKIQNGFILLINNYHFGYLCDDLNFDCDCILQESDKNLQNKLRKMPKELRQFLIDYVEDKYKTLRDVFPRIIIDNKNNK